MNLSTKQEQSSDIESKLSCYRDKWGRDKLED